MADKFDDMFHIDGLVRGELNPEGRAEYFKSLSDKGKQAYISHITLPILYKLVEPELYAFWASLRASSRNFDLSRVLLNEADQALVKSGINENLIKYLRTFGFAFLGDFGNPEDKGANKDAKKSLLDVVRKHDDLVARPFPGYMGMEEESAHVIYMNAKAPPKIFRDSLEYILQFLPEGPSIQGKHLRVITYYQATDLFMDKQKITQTDKTKETINLMRVAAAQAMGTLGYLSIKANGKGNKIPHQPLLTIPEYIFFGVFPGLEHYPHGPRFVMRESPGFPLFQAKAKEYLTKANGGQHTKI